MGGKIFISHRQDEKEIPDIIRKELKDWGVDPARIFQSSVAGQGCTLGEPLNDELKEALLEASLLILTYTHSDLDWSYCWYEVGLGTDPKTPHTRIVVFQCTEDEPKVHKDLTRVKVKNSEDILNFTNQFHKQEGFFPNDPAFQPGIDEDTINRRSARLYKELNKVIPTGGTQEMYRWDYFTLELSSSALCNIGNSQKEEPSEEDLKTIEADLKVVKVFGEAITHFGYHAYEPNSKFSDLLDRWRARAPDSPTDWITELYKSIWRAIQNMPSKAKMVYLKSARRQQDDLWFYPVVNHARKLPANRMHFLVYLYEMPPPN